MTAAVLELGAQFTKCGFAGESEPRHCFPTASLVADMRGRHGGALRNRLHRWLRACLFDVLHVDPSEQRCVVLVHHVDVSSQWIVAATAVLEQRLRVARTVALASEPAAVLAAGRSTALVLDMGGSSVRVVPVFATHRLVECATVWPGGGARHLLSVARAAMNQVLHEAAASSPRRPQLARTSAMRVALASSAAVGLAERAIAQDRGPTATSGAQPSMLTLEQVDVILRSKAGQQALLPAAEQDDDCRKLPWPLRALCVQMHGGKAAVGWRALREGLQAVERAVFEEDGNLDSLPMAVLRCLHRTPIDVRRALASSLLFVGQGTLLLDRTRRHELLTAAMTRLLATGEAKGGGHHHHGRGDGPATAGPVIDGGRPRRTRDGGAGAADRLQEMKRASVSASAATTPPPMPLLRAEQAATPPERSELAPLSASLRTLSFGWCAVDPTPDAPCIDEYGWRGASMVAQQST